MGKALEFAPPSKITGRTKKLTAACYAQALNAYQEIGLLHDIPLPMAKQKPDFFHMCLARAEEYRLTRSPSTGPGPVLEKELPLGPLGLIKFVHHKHLEKYLDGEQVESVCCICRDPVLNHGAALRMCECTHPYCRKCVKEDLAVIHDQNDEEDSRSYLSKLLLQHGNKYVTSAKCYCRSLSYTVFGFDKVYDEDYRLIDKLRQSCGMSERTMTFTNNDAGMYYKCVGEKMIVELTKRPEFQDGGIYQKLVPSKLIYSLLDWVKSGYFSQAQRQAAILCRLLENGPTMVDNEPTLPLGPSENYSPLKDVVLEAILENDMDVDTAAQN